MDAFIVERLFAYERLERWRDSIEPSLIDRNQHDADWVLASAVCDAHPSGDIMPTVIERVAADILRILCVMETSVSNGEASLLFNGRPQLLILIDSLQARIATLEELTGDFSVSAVDESGSENSNYKPVQRQQFQEQEILRVIRSLEYNPKELPKLRPGKSGVKAEVRAKLSFAPGVFDKAWERLKKSKDVQHIK